MVNFNVEGKPYTTIYALLMLFDKSNLFLNCIMKI